jgi:hypothetical protein
VKQMLECRGRTGMLGFRSVFVVRGGADVVRRGGAVMWGWLVRMTKEDGRAGQWPPPEATQCFSLHRPARE